MTRPQEYSFFDTDWGRYSSQQVPHVPTPSGFSAVGSTARVHQYQGPDETKPIGVPGTTLNQGHPDDKIMSIGGNFIVMGAAPGAETLRMQGKGGSAVEFSSDGSLKMVSAKGLHIASSGDGQWLISGDLCLTASGDIKLKGGGFYVDCADFIVNASGSMVQNITGDYNLNVSGDNHTTTQGDKTDVTAGTFRSLVAGQTLIQSHERIKIATNKSYELSAKDKGFIECKGDMTILTEGDMKQGSHGNFFIKSKGFLDHTIAGNVAFETQGAFTADVKGATTFKGTGATKITTQGSMDIGSTGAMHLQTDGNLTIGAEGTAVLDSTGDLYVSSDGTLHAAAPTQKYKTDWIAGGVNGFAQNVSKDAPDTPDPSVAKTKTEAPTDEEIHENTKQFSAKRTDYKLKHVGGGLGAIHAMYGGGDAGDDSQMDDKIKKEVDRHYGSGEYDKYKQAQDKPIPYAGATDNVAVPQYIQDEHTGLA